MKCAIGKSILAAVLLPFASGATAEIRMSIIPERPVQNAPVYVRITAEAGDVLDSGSFDYSKSFLSTAANGTMEIVPASTVLAPPQGEPIDYTYYLGRFPVGKYRVALARAHPGFEDYAKVSFEIASSSRGRFEGDEADSPIDHSGIWWNPDEPGTSLVLNMSPHSRDLGGGFYAYDNEGQPVWYALAPGEWLHADLNDYRVKVLRSHGSGFAQPFDPDAFGSEEVGEIELHFIGIDTLQADYAIEGVERSVTFKRFEF